VLLLNECLLLLSSISLTTQSGNFWIHRRIRLSDTVHSDETSILRRKLTNPNEVKFGKVGGYSCLFTVYEKGRRHQHNDGDNQRRNPSAIRLGSVA
jgi:hypothetical protein